MYKRQNVGHAREMDGCIVAESIEEFIDAMRYLAQNPDIRYNNCLLYTSTAQKAVEKRYNEKIMAHHIQRVLDQWMKRTYD